MCEKLPITRTRRRFTSEEDKKLKKLVGNEMKPDWPAIAQKMYPLTARQCREHWRDFLSPSNNNGPWTQDEDERLIEFSKTGNTHWTALQKFFPGRNAIQIKNRIHQLQRKENRLMMLKIQNEPVQKEKSEVSLPQIQDQLQNNGNSDEDIFPDLELLGDEWP
jgi:hypothetical protein